MLPPLPSLPTSTNRHSMPLPKGFRDWLVNESGAWNAEGLIEKEQRERILARYRRLRRRPAPWPSRCAPWVSCSSAPRSCW
ncbi:hypothetical protein EMGBD4_07340 [Verrucomicrobiota bacterium]|nr:hypothetical protein EMGBD4_07340 [Verrucomicrobiota bacterium]